MSASSPPTTAPATQSAAPTTEAPREPASTTEARRHVPDGVSLGSACLQRAAFGDPHDSEYLLPFNVGESHAVSQSYCFDTGGHRRQLAYDFVMPIGADVLAARAGTVREIKEDSPDTGEGEGEHNYVFIEHDDGTVAFYAHLMQGGVDVEPGDEVEAGERIGASGNSGQTGSAHLHFGVYGWWPPEEGFDVPVNFRNADGRFDPNGGLMWFERYEALPWAE